MKFYGSITRRNRFQGNTTGRLDSLFYITLEFTLSDFSMQGLQVNNAVNIWSFKVNNSSTRKRYEICSKLTIKFRGCLFNNLAQKNYQTKRPLNIWLALNVRVVYNSDSIWISIIMLQIPTSEPKKHKKTSAVFDEGLQILVSSERCIWNSLFKVSINTWKN